MKTTKIFLFILLSFFFISINSVNADTGTGSVTVTVTTPPISGVCGSSNGMSFYVAPTSGHCSSGTYSGISGSGPWTWSCSGLYGGSTSSCSANKAVDGGWSGWSTPSSQCGYTGTQTRTCTNPSPAYGGADCVGSTTQSYTNSPCPVDGYWSSWSTPSSQCGYTGTQTRSCIGPYYGGAACVGSTTQSYTNPPCPINGACGSSNGMSFYSSPTSGYCSSGTYSGISGSGPWTWSCGGSYGGSTASCSANKAVDCVGSWSDTATCSASCGGGVKQQVYTITTPASNGGVSCPYTNGAVQWGGTSCNTFCCSPLTQTQTIQCSSRSSAWTGTINQISTKSAYPGCSFGSWVDSTNNCSCAAPSYELQTVSCPTGYSGSITEERDKGAYSACLFGGWYQTYNGCTINSYIVSTSAGAGGSISPTSRTVNYGSTTTFTITPDSSHLINSVSGCGGSLSGSTYTTGAITGACTISATFKAMSGTLTPTTSSCVIPLNSSSCTTTLSWSTTNPVGTSAVTASGMTSVNANSGSQAFTVPYNSRTFYLYNNGIELAQASATSSCTVNTHWDGNICAIDTNLVSTSINTGGSISPTSRTVNYGATTTFTITPNAGYSIGGVSGCSGSGSSTYTTGAITSSCTVSVNFTLNTHTLTVNKTGSGYGTVGGAGTYNYGTTQTATATPSTGSIFSGWSGDCNSNGQVYMNSNKVCTATFLLMSGTLTPATSSCVIPLNSSSCTTTLSWSTTNPVGTSAITASGMTSVSGNSGSQAFTVPYNSRTFYLYNSSVLLAQASATSSCAGGTSWNGTKCAAPSGTLTASNCTIAQGASSCNTNLIWSTTDPIGTSAVTTPTGITVATANSSAGTSYVVNYPSRIFYLYNNAVELKNVTATATCTNGTTWDGAKCAPIIITFSAAPTDVAYNTAATLTWSAANATTCTASGGWSGSRATSGSVSTGNLTLRTTFTLSCTGLNGTNGTASVIVTVGSFGTLTASNCTILPAQNKCNTNLVWNTYNPLATSAVTTPTNITVLSANSSAGTSYSVDYGTRDFYLYNNGVLLATATARASCEQVWDAPSGVCVTVPTLTSPISNTVSALSAKVGATVATLGIPAAISARGVCYSSTMQNPGVNNNGNGAICGVDGSNTSLGAFTIYIMKILSPNTTYYYRGYATNIAGTGYSPQGSFTTLVLPPEASVVKFKEVNDKGQIDYGQSITLTWDSSNAYYGCTLTSNFDPSTNIISSLDPNTSKNNITLKPTKTTVYTLICSGEGGTSSASQVQIKVGKISPIFNEF